jgi:hypothetical protein
MLGVYYGFRVGYVMKLYFQPWCCNSMMKKKYYKKIITTTKVSMYTKWLHWILSEFIGCNEEGPVKKWWIH